MAALDQILTKLTTDSVIDGSTWTGKAGYYPATPDKIVAVLETNGSAPPEAEPDATREYDYLGFQVLIRGAAWGYEAARTKATDVFNSLHDSTITDFVYLYARHAPISLGYDEENRPMLTVNFDAMRVR